MADINHAISFLANGTRYYGNSNLPTDGFSKNLTFNDFVPSFLDSQYDDSDGDSQATTAITHNGFTIEWKDKYNQIITNYGDNISSCYSPYQLTIKASNVDVHSEYGDPIINSLGNLSHTSTIYVDDYEKICGIKPFNTDFVKASGSTPWQVNVGNGTQDPDYGGGFESTQFSPLLGFDPYLSPDKFPTTAFPHAKFSIVLPEPQTNYTITQIAGNGIILDDSVRPATVTFTNKPTAPISIKVEYSGWSDTYTFNVNSFGASFGTATGGASQALGFCPLFPRAKLSNSPLVNKISSFHNPTNYNNGATRKVGSFTGEWGNMATYSGSGIGGGFYWTSEDAQDGVNQFVVDFNYGASFVGDKTRTDFTIFCEQ